MSEPKYPLPPFRVFDETNQQLAYLSTRYGTKTQAVIEAIDLLYKQAQAAEKRFWKKVQRLGPDDCWNWLANRTVRDGYGHFKFGKWMVVASRVAWVLTNGPIPRNILVCHRCDNRLCCNPNHLFLGTHKTNSDDKMTKNRGNHVMGERHGLSKLTEERVKSIREMYASGMSQSKIAAQMGVDQTTVSRVVRRAGWLHIL